MTRQAFSCFGHSLFYQIWSICKWFNCFKWFDLLEKNLHHYVGASLHGRTLQSSSRDFLLPGLELNFVR
jgi:hypothetical protein